MKAVRGQVGARVRALRRGRRWTQEQLAERAGLSYKFVGEIERGRGNPTIETLARLAQALGVDTGQLFPQAGTIADISSPGDYHLSKREMSLVREAVDSLASVLRRTPHSRRTRRCST